MAPLGRRLKRIAKDDSERAELRRAKVREATREWRARQKVVAASNAIDDGSLHPRSMQRCVKEIVEAYFQGRTVEYQSALLIQILNHPSLQDAMKHAGIPSNKEM